MHHVIVLRPIIIAFFILNIILIGQVQPSSQQTPLCAKNCHCDEQTLETVCRGSMLTAGVPLFVNPSTKRLAINYAQTAQFSTLDYIKNLETLDLAHNKITVIDFVHINSNGNLISLNASHNNISELKDSTVSAVINKLEPGQSNPFVNFDSDELVPDKVKALRKAKINVLELVLSHNHLTILKNFTFLRWVRLQSLDLSFNSLVVLEADSLFGLTKLKQLNLRGNHLTQVPEQAFTSLTRSLNPISSSNDQTIAQLKSLDLSENVLVSLEPKSFSALGQLQELYLETCSLQSVHEQAFSDLTNLNLLSLSYNDLIDVPTNSFTTLSSLKRLILDSNHIQLLRANAFTNLFNLEELQINNGSLRELQPGALSGLISLRWFSSAHNSHLTRVYPDLLDDVPRLVHLNLSTCALPSLPRETSLDDHPLSILDLRGNPLKCDCQLKWLTKCLARLNETIIATLAQGKTPPSLNGVAFQDHVKNHLTEAKVANDLVNITCAVPPALAGKPVIDLPDKKLECIRPTSTLNLHVGFASLFLITLLLVTACLINFCRSERHFMGLIKENLAQNRMSIMLPHSQDLHANMDNLKKETQIECAEYEPVDYGQAYGPIYTVPGDQYMLHNSTSSQQHTHQM